MEKWNFKTRKYEDFKPKHNKKAALIADELTDIISCAECGKDLEFGDSYTSLTIHSMLGLGYCVCEECYSKEWEDRVLYGN